MTTAKAAAELSAADRAAIVIANARALGFHRVGIVPIEPPRRYDTYKEWLAAGHHGTMAYMEAPEHQLARADVRKLLASAKSVVIVALAYAKSGGDQSRPGAVPGFVARYARGRDYHAVVKSKLHRLVSKLESAFGAPIASRMCTDSAPVLERELAERSGIGFVAKNTMLIAPGLGSYVVLGELLLDVDLAPTADAPSKPRCGSCRTCLDACPTGAFVDAYVLDARRCISYLTIEHRGVIPRDLRAPMGTMVFGCDICQQVCPFNAAAPDRHAADAELMPTAPDRGTPDLLELIALGANQRRKLVDGTAMRRVNREQFLRNVCIGLGNAGDARAVPALTDKLADRSAVVRGHAAWALGRLGAKQALEAALEFETDDTVREEIRAALTG